MKFYYYNKKNNKDSIDEVSVKLDMSIKSEDSGKSVDIDNLFNEQDENWNFSGTDLLEASNNQSEYDQNIAIDIFNDHGT